MFCFYINEVFAISGLGFYLKAVWCNSKSVTSYSRLYCETCHTVFWKDVERSLGVLKLKLLFTSCALKPPHQQLVVSEEHNFLQWLAGCSDEDLPFFFLNFLCHLYTIAMRIGDLDSVLSVLTTLKTVLQIDSWFLTPSQPWWLYQGEQYYKTKKSLLVLVRKIGNVKYRYG